MNKSFQSCWALRFSGLKKKIGVDFLNLKSRSSEHKCLILSSRHKVLDPLNTVCVCVCMCTLLGTRMLNVLYKVPQKNYYLELTPLRNIHFWANLPPHIEFIWMRSTVISTRTYAFNVLGSFSSWLTFFFLQICRVIRF